MGQLRSLTLAGGVWDEAGGAFIRSNAETLETIDLLACNNATLPDGALAGCYHMKNILLPASLTQTGYGAFKGCTALASVTLPASLVEVGDRAFEDCRSLTSVQFAWEGALTRIGNWAFYNCHQLQALQLPEGVAEVGLAAFYGCSYLEDIELPSTLRSIGDHAFAHNVKARKMTVHAAVPPVVEAKTFLRVSRDMPVYVPAESLASYQAAAYWQDLNLQPIGDATGMGHLSLSENITVVNGEVHIINMTGTGEVQVDPNGSVKYVITDVRTTDRYSNAQIVKILQSDFSDVEITPRSLRLNSSSLSMQHPFVKRCLLAGRQPFGSPTLSDQALMPFPSVKIGPGQSSRSHTADEYIVTDEIREAIELYTCLLDQLHIEKN